MCVQMYAGFIKNNTGENMCTKRSAVVWPERTMRALVAEERACTDEIEY